MNSGYDHFFKKAKENSGQVPSKRAVNLSLGRASNSNSVSSHGSAGSIEAEQSLRKAVGIKRKKSKRGKLNPAFLSISLFMMSGFGFLVLFVSEPGLVEKFIDRIEFGFFSEVFANEPSPGTAQKSGKEGENISANKDSDAEKKASDLGPEADLSKSVDSNDLSYFSKLNERKKELDLREKELNELEEELHKQKSEIEERIQHLERIRVQIAGVLKDKVEVDQQKVKTLVEFYSNMKPQQAAKVIGTLNEDLAIEVLGQMKKKNAAEIMNLLEPSKAQIISEKFAGYKRR